MPAVLADKVVEYCSTLSTSDYSLGIGAAGVSRTFASKFADQALVPYVARRVDATVWEIGIGKFVAGVTPSLQRITILDSSSGGSSISWVPADTNYIIYSPQSNYVVDNLVQGNLGATAPNYLPAGGQWWDNSAGTAVRWLRKLRLAQGGSDVNMGAYHVGGALFTASQAHLWVDNAAAGLTIDATYKDKSILFDVTAANRACTMPAGATLGHGFGFFVTGYGSLVNSIVLTPNGAEKIDLGTGGATLSIPGGTRMVWVEWDGVKLQWRTDYQATPVVYPAFSNVLRNGNMVSWANGGVSAQNLTVGATGAAAITANGWAGICTGATITWAKSTGTAQFANALQLTGNTSVSDIAVAERIEAVDGSTIASKRVTLQALIFNNSGGSITPQCATRYAGSTDTWGAPVADLAATNLQACGNGVWTQVAYTFDVNANAANGYEVKIDFGNNFNTNAKSVKITALDLRITPNIPTGLNSSPPPLEIRDIATEMFRCCRYLQASYDDAVNPATATRNGLTTIGLNTGSAFGGVLLFPIRMRAAPTMSMWDGAGTANVLSYYQGGGWVDSFGNATLLLAGQTSAIITDASPSTTPLMLHYRAYADFW